MRSQIRVNSVFEADALGPIWPWPWLLTIIHIIKYINVGVGEGCMQIVF